MIGEIRAVEVLAVLKRLPKMCLRSVIARYEEGILVERVGCSTEMTDS